MTHCFGTQYYVLPKVPVPKPAPKGDYGKISLKAVLSIFNESYIGEKIVQRSLEPKTFEEMNLNYGYMVYETIIPKNISDPAVLRVRDLRDRAIVYVNHVSIYYTYIFVLVKEQTDEVTNCKQFYYDDINLRF